MSAATRVLRISRHVRRRARLAQLAAEFELEADGDYDHEEVLSVLREEEGSCPRYALVCRDESYTLVGLHDTSGLALREAGAAAQSTEHPRSPVEIVDLESGRRHRVAIAARFGGVHGRIDGKSGDRRNDDDER